jgi:predicted alpha/beta-hydrolase family hydrolase
VSAIALLWNGPPSAQTTIVLAHGAGAPMDSPFMERMATDLATAGLRVARFEFPYMARRREGGRRGGAPDPPVVLLDTWRAVIAQLGGGARLVIGGKSLGGRIASMVADESHVRGLVCLGYPFHPAGQPQRTRTAHLQTLATPTLIVQGERDALGSRAEIGGYALSPAIRLVFLSDGDHSFKPRAASGVTAEANLAAAVAAIVAFMRDLGTA